MIEVKFGFEDKEFINMVRRAASSQAQTAYRAAVSDIQLRILRGVTKRTPVGRYPQKSGYTGGTLRRSWSTKTAKLVPNGIQGEVFNPVYYAVYVEYGHRLRNNAWWEGYHMLNKSVKTVEPYAKTTFKRQLRRVLQSS